MAAPEFASGGDVGSAVSAGTVNWTSTQGSAVGLMSVGCCDSGSVYAQSGTWGGVSAGYTRVSAPYSSIPLSLGGWVDLSGKSGDGRSAYAGDDHDHFDILFTATGDLVIVDHDTTQKDAGTGGMTIDLDPGGYDCIAVVAAQEPRGESTRVADWAYNGSGTVTRRYKLTVGKSSGQHLCIASAPVLASDGPVTFTNAQDQSQPCNGIGMLIGVAPATGRRRRASGLVVL